jgi:hypothetical protein
MLQVLQYVPEVLLQRCLECLAAPSAATPSPPSLDPYSELREAHAQLHRQLVPLLSACLSVSAGSPSRSCNEARQLFFMECRMRKLA